MDEIIHSMSNSYFGYGPAAGVESAHRLLVEAMAPDTSRILIVAALCFVLVHTLTYAISLRLWSAFNVFYVGIYIAEELPNLFNLIITFASIADEVLPGFADVDPGKL